MRSHFRRPFALTHLDRPWHASRRLLIVATCVGMFALSTITAQAGIGLQRGGAVGGVMIDPDGNVRAATEAEQREMIGVFERIMRDKPAFFEFLEESSRVILEIESATLDIDELREHLRWLEVSCGLFGMQSMCTMVSAMRKTLVADGRKELSAENVAQLARKWAATRERIDGFVSGQSTDDPVIELPVAEYTALLAKVRSGGDVAELARSLEAWQDEPVLRWLERCAYQATAVAHRYHKVSLDVAVEGNGVRIDSTTYEPIWEALAHNIPRWVELALLPAASGEEKNEKAKERTAAVRLETIPEGRGFLIRIEVSGSGVDWPKLIHGVDEAQAFKSQIPQISALVQANGISALRELGNLRELAELELACVALGGELSVSCDEPDGPAFLGLRFVAAANTRPVGQAVAI